MNAFGCIVSCGDLEGSGVCCVGFVCVCDVI